MYSAKVLDHLENPRNIGEIAEATARGESFNPVCGDRMILDLRIEGASGDERIVEARFQVEGCPPSIAAGSVLTELITGQTIAAARALTAREVTLALGALPRNKEHCSVLAVDALRAALAS